MSCRAGTRAERASGWPSSSTSSTATAVTSTLPAIRSRAPVSRCGSRRRGLARRGYGIPSPGRKRKRRGGDDTRDVITGLVPVIPVQEAPSLTLSRWPDKPGHDVKVPPLPRDPFRVSFNCHPTVVEETSVGPSCPIARHGPRLLSRLSRLQEQETYREDYVLRHCGRPCRREPYDHGNCC